MINPVDAIAELSDGKPRRTARNSTGFADLDGATGGFDRGQVWIITGTPGQGRSTLATQWAAQIASRHHLRTNLISMREPVRLIATRLVAQTGKVPALHLWNNEFTDEEQARLGRARDMLVDALLLIAGPGDLSLMDADPPDGPWPEALVVDDDSPDTRSRRLNARRLNSHQISNPGRPRQSRPGSATWPRI